MILLDCNAIASKVRFGMDHVMLTAGEMRTEVIFGFLRQLLLLAKQKKDIRDRMVFVWDSRYYHRFEYCPEYKQKRKKELTEWEEERDVISYEQFDLLRQEILPAMGFRNVFRLHGYEADDVIAVLCKGNAEEKITIVTTDQDLYQLLTDNVSFYNLRTKVLYTRQQFTRDYGITPKQWVDVKAYGGCVSDNVKGIKGVGEKTMCKYILKQLKETSVAYKKIVSEEGQSIAKRNRQLVELPFKGTPSCFLKQDVLLRKKFIAVFEKYLLKSFLQGQWWADWQSRFDLQ